MPKRSTTGIRSIHELIQLAEMGREGEASIPEGVNQV